MRIAAVQFRPEFSGPGDSFSPNSKNRERNIQTLVELGTEAARGGAELIVFPELATTGYSFMSVAEAESQAEIVQARRGSVGAMLALAKRLGVGFVWGLVEKSPIVGKLHNSQVMALPDGTLVSYAKVNRWGQDLIWADEGVDSPPIVAFRGFNVGLLICRDIKDSGSGLDDFYEPGDADIVAFSTNWGNGAFPSNRWVNFAKSNNTWLVVANRYGKEANNDFGEGGSCVVSPNGKVHCEGLRWSSPCIVYADI
jgi:predicted amidohydrolase